MSVALLDVNVLMALAWPNHVHHRAAHAGFGPRRRQGWATTPITQIGFIRVSSNTRAIPEARTPLEARELLRRILTLEGHVFWPDDVGISEPPPGPMERVVGYRQVTDAHLLTLALRHGGRLATFDRGTLDLVPEGVDASEVVELLA